MQRHPAIEFDDLLADQRGAVDRPIDRRPLLAVAAVVLVVVGLVAVDQVRHPEEGSATLSFEPGPSSVVGMPFAVVRPALPDGWRFVDLFDSGQSQPAGPESSYLFRNPTSGAAVYVQTGPRFDVPNPGPFRDLRESFDASGAATYAVDGSFVWMRIAGIDTDEGVALAEALVLPEASVRTVSHELPGRFRFRARSESLDQRGDGDERVAGPAASQDTERHRRRRPRRP